MLVLGVAGTELAGLLNDPLDFLGVYEPM